MKNLSESLKDLNKQFWVNIMTAHLDKAGVAGLINVHHAKDVERNNKNFKV